MFIREYYQADSLSCILNSRSTIALNIFDIDKEEDILKYILR